MSIIEILLISIIVLPLLIAAAELFMPNVQEKVQFAIVGYSGAIIPLIVSISLSIYLMDSGNTIRISIPFLNVMDLSWAIEARALTTTVLSALLACFTLTQILNQSRSGETRSNVGLILFLQSTVTLMLLSKNLLLFAFMQIVSAFIIFLLYKSSLNDDRGINNVRAWAAERFLGLQFVSAIFIVVLTSAMASAFGNGVFDFTTLKGLYSNIASTELFTHINLLFLVPCILSLPVIPWFHWLAPLFENRKIPSAINILVSSFLSAMVFVYFDLFHMVLENGISQNKTLVALVGIFLCVANLSFALVEDSARKKFSYLSSYLFAYALYSLGFSGIGNYYLGILLLLIAPILAATYEYFCAKPLATRFGKVMFIFLVLYTIGFPGTPIYYVFALNSVSAFSVLDPISFSSLLLWLLYVLVAVVCVHSIWSRRTLLEAGSEKENFMISSWNSGYGVASSSLFVLCLFSLVVANLLGSVF